MHARHHVNVCFFSGRVDFSNDISNGLHHVHAHSCLVCCGRRHIVKTPGGNHGLSFISHLRVVQKLRQSVSPLIEATCRKVGCFEPFFLTMCGTVRGSRCDNNRSIFRFSLPPLLIWSRFVIIICILVDWRIRTFFSWLLG